MTATLGNSISENLGNGVTVNGPGSLGNAIRRGVLVGGPSDADRNTITGNRGYGLFVTGNSAGSSVQRNVISGNGRNVVTSRAFGLAFRV